MKGLDGPKAKDIGRNTLAQVNRLNKRMNILRVLSEDSSRCRIARALARARR